MPSLPERIISGSWRALDSPTTSKSHGERKLDLLSPRGEQEEQATGLTR